MPVAENGRVSAIEVDPVSEPTARQLFMSAAAVVGAMVVKEVPTLPAEFRILSALNSSA